jgi:RecA-family ATPase
MIDGIWTEGAHGIIGGEPKTLKTTLALAMGLAVASGKPFLGTFEVPTQGPVLMVQEENSAENVQDVMKKVASSYGLISKNEVTISPSPEGSIGSTVASVRFPDDIPFQILNNSGFSMSDESQREALENSVRLARPKMLILDPFEKMIGNADLDRSHEIRPFLLWLMHMRFEYSMAVVLVHHMRKQHANRPGQRMLGSMTFHAWTASAMYVSSREESEDTKRIEIEREFREQGPQPGLKVDLRMGPPGSLDFDAYVGSWNQGDVIYDLVVGAGGRMLMSEALKTLDIGGQALNRRVHGHERLIMEGRGGRGDPRYIVLTGEDGNVPSAE